MFLIGFAVFDKGKLTFSKRLLAIIVKYLVFKNCIGPGGIIFMLFQLFVL